MERRRSTSARLPAVLLAMLLLLATELATFGCCSHRIPRPDDVVAWRRHGPVAVAVAARTRTTTATVREAASATAPAAARDAEATFGESKRLVPQGSNPLHN